MLAGAVPAQTQVAPLIAEVRIEQLRQNEIKEKSKPNH
jgi:hypothetical protein